MGRIVLICRLAARDLRHHPAQAALMLLAITAATATLTLGLALHGVTSQPYQQTRAATNGPDVVAQLGGPGGSLARAPGVTGHSGPYPVASAILRVRGVMAGAEVEGRSQAPAAIDQPKVTAGGWVRPGGIVLERAFAEALGAGVGDRLTLNGRYFRVAGIAVTAASAPYPNTCSTGCVYDLPGPRALVTRPGLIWATQPDARVLATPAAPLSYFLNLRLRNPAQAEALAPAYDNAHPGAGEPFLISWQAIRAADGLLVTDEQQVLTPGSWLLGLLAVASVAVLAGGRMAEQTRRVGLLKAVGGTPRLVAAVLLAEHLGLALAAAAAGLAAGRLAAPLLTSPGAALVGTPGAPTLTPGMAGLVVAVALAVALAATLLPALRAARTSTVAALADAARPPRHRAALIALSRRLPTPLLIGLRLVARRPRRFALSAASIAVTVTGIVAVLTFYATVHQHGFGRSPGLSDPVAGRDSQVLVVLMAIGLVLAALNTIFTAWVTTLEARHPSALMRALGMAPQQVSAGISAALLFPALPGALVGIPAGIGLFAAANGAGTAATTVPPGWWLGAAALGAVLAVVGLASIPARIGARQPVALG